LERAAATVVALSTENDALRVSQPQQAAHPGPEVRPLPRTPRW
jgi:hypothetical protein